MRGNLKAIHPFREVVLRFKITRACEKTRTTQGTGTGGARAAISQPEAVAVTTRTVNPCGPAHPCRLLERDQEVTTLESAGM
jgi:hypothetical protein